MSNSKVSLSVFTLAAFSYEKAVQDGAIWKKFTQKEVVSKGTFSYSDGTYGYYRRCRYGYVLGFGNKEIAKLEIQDLTGKTTAILKVVPGAISGYTMRKGRKFFYRGLPTFTTFRSALTALFAGHDKEDSIKPIKSEVWAAFSILVNNTLQLWDRNGHPSCDLASKEVKVHVPMNTVLFPLLGGHNVVQFNSKTKEYRFFKGLYSLKLVAEKYLGSTSKTAVKLVKRCLAQSHFLFFLEAMGALLRHGFTLDEITMVPDYVINAMYHPENTETLVNVLKRMTLNRLASLEPSKDSQINHDTVRLVVRLPEGVKVDKNCRNVTHLHEVCSYVINRWQDEDYYLWSHPQFADKEGTEVGGYTVVFPHKESDLKAWGAALGICIGGYGNDVHAGHSICFALYKGTEVKVCVEISGGTFSLRQVKGHRNGEMGVELWEALEAHFELNTKTFESMVDYDRPKQITEEEEGKDTQSLYKEAVYRTTRLEEWAHIECLHEDRPRSNYTPF